MENALTDYLALIPPLKAGCVEKYITVLLKFGSFLVLRVNLQLFTYTVTIIRPNISTTSFLKSFVVIVIQRKLKPNSVRSAHMSDRF